MILALALILFSGIRGRMDVAHVHETFKGYPLALITSRMMSLAFIVFRSLVKI